MDNPQILYLKRLVSDFRFQFEVLPLKHGWEESWMHWVKFSFGDKEFLLLIEDEYEDLAYQYPPLVLFLILLELDLYEHIPDFLEWSQEKMLPPDNNAVWNHYRMIDIVLHYFKKLIPDLHTGISSFDYHLGAGETRKIREEAAVFLS